MITNKTDLVKKVYDDYRKDSVELSSAYFDFDVSMDVQDILEAYAILQWRINGDIVGYPRGERMGHFMGNCKRFLETCNGRPWYVRIVQFEKNGKAENEFVDFVF